MAFQRAHSIARRAIADCRLCDAALAPARTRLDSCRVAKLGERCVVAGELRGWRGCGVGTAAVSDLCVP
eukprot:4402354-Prymnesium_polylepis.1